MGQAQNEGRVSTSVSRDLASRVCSRSGRECSVCACVCVWAFRAGDHVSSVPEEFSMRALSSALISRCVESLVTASTHSSRSVARVSIRPHLEDVSHSAHTAQPAPQVPHPHHH